MPSRKRTSSMLNGDAEDNPKAASETTAHDDALALAEEAEAEAAIAEADAAAARARARALKLRRQAEVSASSAKAASDPELPEVDEPTTSTEPQSETDTETATAAPPVFAADAEESDGVAIEAEETDEDVDEPGRRRLKLPRIGRRTVAAGLVVVVSLGLLGASGWMIWQHRQVAAEEQRSAEFAAAARQGVVTLMSLNFNRAEEDVKRILDNTTGDFRKDFESQAGDFVKVAQDSKVITETIVNAAAVDKMTRDTATVLVAATTNVSNAASEEQQPRSWRLMVDVARDGEQIKLAKVEFVP